jgi:hypothetical protein
MMTYSVWACYSSIFWIKRNILTIRLGYIYPISEIKGYKLVLIAYPENRWRTYILYPSYKMNRLAFVASILLAFVCVVEARECFSYSSYTKPCRHLCCGKEDDVSCKRSCENSECSSDEDCGNVCCGHGRCSINNCESTTATLFIVSICLPIGIVVVLAILLIALLQWCYRRPRTPATGAVIMVNEVENQTQM